MVEKIDKTEPKSMYQIEEAPAAGDDRGSKGRQREDDGDEYSGSFAGPGWQKAYSSLKGRRYLKLSRSNVLRAYFRATTMMRGISLAEVDIETRDGRMLRGAHVVLGLREDFWTLKKYQFSQEVPLNILFKDEIIEISVPQENQNGGQKAKPPFKALEPKRSGFNKDILIYSFILITVLLLILFLILK